MKKIDVMAVSLNLTALDLGRNLQKIRETFRFIHDRDLPGVPYPKAKFVVFPEFPLSGHIGDLFSAPQIQERILNETLRLLPETRSIVAVISIPLNIGGKLYRGALVAADGEIAGFVCSQKVPPALSRWFSSWGKGVRTTLPIGEKEFPAGDLFFDISGVRIAVAFDPFEEEIPFPGIDILAIPGADPFELERAPKRREALRRLSEKSQCAVVFANLSGNETGRIIYDGESAVSETGRLLALERRFSYFELSHLTAAVDLDQVRRSRPDSRPSAPPPVRGFESFDWGWHNQRRYAPLGFYRESDPESPPLEEWETSPDLPFEEFSRAVAVGLYDYLRKSRSHGFVLSLSGGADSASIAALVSLMIWFGFTSLGKRRFLETLSYIEGIANLAALPPQQITPQKTAALLLTTVYQQTANNSQVTFRAAEAVAAEVGADHNLFEIEELVQSYLRLGAKALGRPLDWTTDDLAMQNIQARVRGPAAWLLANLKKGLLLATGNRSEAACGYATMDGDTCGAISPIAGISKEFLRRWLVWLETTGPILSPPLFPEDGMGKEPFRVRFESMSQINRQQPTAELRPLAALQTDEADLMPYTVLQVIERGITVHLLLGAELRNYVARHLQNLPGFSDVKEEQIDAWVVKFQRLFAQSQWKRFRYPMGFHLESEDLNPDCYMIPPLSSGFQAWDQY